MKKLKETENEGKELTENEGKELFECFNKAFCKHLKLPAWFLDPGRENKTDEN